VTPPIDTTGYSVLNLSFKHVLETFNSGGVTIKIQTSPDGSTWTDEAWSVLTASSNTGPETVQTMLTQNLNRATTYVAFVITGNLHYFDVWYIDDVRITATAPGTLKAPVLLKPSNGARRQPTVIKLSWSDTNVSPAEAGYRIRIKPNGGTYTYYTVGQNIQSYELSGLLTNKKYYWNVLALGNNDGIADSPWSNSGKDNVFTTNKKVTLNAPILGEAVNIGSNQPSTLTLLWQDTNHSPEETKYKIRIKPAGGRYKFYSAGRNAAKFLAKKLLCDKTYYWNVQAKGNKRTTLDSAWANSGVDKSFTTQLQ
jgi:hypothetical protein